MSALKILGRHKTFPLTLYRLQKKKEVKLNDFLSQQKLGENVYDFHIKEDGLVHPNNTEFFHYPNGMSMRPLGEALTNIAKNYEYTYAYEIPKNTPVPDDLILIHEHTDSYSLQTSTQCTPEQLHLSLNKFLSRKIMVQSHQFQSFLEGNYRDIENLPILVVFDLDHTILDLNTDVELIKILEKRCPEKVAKIRKINNWATYMNNIMHLMHEEGFQIPEIKNLIENLEYNLGFKELFSFIEKNKNRFEVVIFSGCNTIFVDWIIKNKKIEKIISKFYSNLAEITPDGKMNIKPTHLHDCVLCDLSQCKQKLLKEYVTERKNIQFRKIVFIGDGKNDFCLTKGLTTTDLVCYRVGYQLENDIRNWKKFNSTDEYLTDLCPWNNGFEILDRLDKLV